MRQRDMPVRKPHRTKGQAGGRPPGHIPRIHYFYLGKTTGGIITIVLSLCTCGLWSVVTLIQGILMLVSTDEAFAEKYVDNDRKFPLF